MHPLVILTRTNRVESIHKGYICITNANKESIYSIGNPDKKIFLRSSAKPIQAATFVYSGAMDKFNISLQELSVICSSHSGEDFHRQAVDSILKKIGLREEDLDCGVANPYNQDMINNLIKNGKRPSQLYNCCSGKHAGMLALCRYYGYPVKGYTNSNHPLQHLILKTTAELLECSSDDITLGIDGCGVPTYMVTLNQASYLYCLLGQGENGKSKYKDSLGVIKNAMVKYPRMVNGDREFCTDLITHSQGRAIGKVGAEGIYCIAVPEKQLGICIKIYDGNERAVYPAAIHILRQLEVLNNTAIKELRLWAYPPLKNHRGELIGYTVPVFDINQDNNITKIEVGEKFEFKGEDLWNH